MQLVDQELHTDRLEHPVHDHATERGEQEPVVELLNRLEGLRALAGDEQIPEQHGKRNDDEHGIQAAARDVGRLVLLDALFHLEDRLLQRNLFGAF